MRFYKPRLREYVSTQVDMPWEFLQGVAEQKQKGYDTALATGDAAGKLLNFDVIPGDVQAKNEIQKKYNDRIMKIQDYIQSTGDFNAASREFTGIIRDIAQDPYINNMKAAVPIWKEQQKGVEDLKSNMEIAPFNDTWNYMYSTVDPQTGMSRSYNQRIPYKARTVGEAFKKELEDSVANFHANKTGQRIRKTADGYWIDESSARINEDQLTPLFDSAFEEIQDRYAPYIQDRFRYEKGQGKSGLDWFSNMKSQVIGERLVNDYEIKLIEDNFETGKKLEELKKTSSFLDLTGQSYPESFNYKALIMFNDAGQKQLEQYEQQLASGNLTITERSKIKANADFIRNQIAENKSKLAYINTQMITTGNGDELYNEYVEGVKNLNGVRKNQGLTSMLPIESKEQFFKYLSGEKALPRKLSGPGVSTLLDALKSKFVEKAQEISSDGKYVIEEVTMHDVNPSSTYSQLTETIKNSIFNKTLNATASIDGILVNVTDHITEEYPEADPNKSTLIPIKTSSTDQIQFRLTLRDKDGKELKSFKFNSAKDAAEINREYNKVLRINAKQSEKAGDLQGYFKNAERLADINYGKGLTTLRAYSNNQRVISKKDPVQVGRFYIFNAMDNNNNPILDAYVMTQGQVDSSGNIILSSQFERNPTDPSISYLSYEDIVRKLGSEIINQ
jgi:hypothetical protein